MSRHRITVCGDDLLLVRTQSTAESARLAARIRGSEGWPDVVPGIGDVVVRFDAAVEDTDAARQRLAAVLDGPAPEDTERPGRVEIPVMYGGECGPDFEWICEQTGLSRKDFIALHTGVDHTVDMLGFTPGFAYVGGLDSRLDVPRLAEPRAHVAAGSIGIAGGRTGIYALAGPGGWPLIGRTALTLFDPQADSPFLLEAGMRVRFTDASA